MPINKWVTSLGKQHIDLEKTTDVQLQNLRKSKETLKKSSYPVRSKHKTRTSLFHVPEIIKKTIQSHDDHDTWLNYWKNS